MLIDLNTAPAGRIGEPNYFSDLLGAALRGLFSGAIQFTVTGGDAIVYFKEGNPVGTGGPGLANDKLGELLVMRRVCTADEIDAIVSQQARGPDRVPLGQLLVSRGKLEEKVLEEAIQHQITRRVSRLFGMTGGTFKAQPGLPKEIEKIAYKMDGWTLILPCLKAFISDDEQRELADRTLGKAVHLKVKPHLVEKFRPDELDLKVFKYLEKPRKPDQIERALKERKRVRVALKAVLATGMAELLSVKKAVPIKKTVAAVGAPSKIPGRPSNPPPAPPRSRVQSEVVTKPLTDSERKKERAKKAATRAAAAPTSRKPIEPKKKPEPPSKAIIELRELKKKMGDLNYFELLGVKQDASTPDIRAAYGALAKKYHPDALGQGVNDDDGSLAREVSSKLNEAWSTLSNEDRRRDYIQALASGVAYLDEQSEQKAKTAKMKYDMAVVHMRKREFGKARDLLKFAQNYDKNNALYKGTMAWAIWSDPSYDRKQAAVEAERMLLEALKLKKDIADFHYYLGQIFKSRGDTEKAKTAFRQATHIDAKHTGAAQELRVLEGRSGKDKNDKGGLSKLFKR